MEAEKPKKDYWTDETEEQIKAYIAESNPTIKNMIFERHLYNPLCKLIENIVFSYKLYNFNHDGLNDIRQQIIFHLLQNMDKYDASRGTKAYSYFGTAVRNYLIQKVKKSHEFYFFPIDADLNELYHGDEDNKRTKDNNIVNSVDFSYRIDEENVHAQMIDRFIDELKLEIDMISPIKEKNIQNWVKFLNSLVLIMETNKSLSFIDNKVIFYSSLKKINGFSNGKNYKYMNLIRDKYVLFKKNFFKN